MKYLMLFPLLFLLVFTTEVEAQFMRIDGINGESEDARHREWSDIESVNFSISAPSPNSGNTRQRPIANFGDISVSKTVDKASPEIAKAVASGKGFARVTIDLVDSRKMVYLQIILEKVQFTSYQMNGTRGDRAVEELTLNFKNIQYIYPRTKTRFEWNTKTGAPK